MITAIEARGLVARAADLLRQVEAVVAGIARSIHEAAAQGQTHLACELGGELPMVARTMVARTISRHGYVVTLDGKNLSVSWAGIYEGGPAA